MTGSESVLPAPRVGLGTSCVAFIRESCRQTDRCHGGIEIPWFIFGREVDGFLLGFHARIPRATCGEASFEVAPSDLSALNRRVAATRPDLRLMVVAHRHPGLVAPLPSGVDLRDRDRMSRLFSVFNRRSLVLRQVLEPSGNGHGLSYRLGRLGRKVDIVLEAGAGGAPLAPPPRLLWEEHVSLSFHGFVVFNADGDPEKSYAQVVRICSDRLAAAGEAGPEVALFECPLEVLPDEEVARLAGLPRVRVAQRSRPDKVRKLVAARLSRRRGYGWPAFGSREQPLPYRPPLPRTLELDATPAAAFRPASGYAWERHDRIRSVQAASVASAGVAPPWRDPGPVLADAVPAPDLRPDELRDLVDGEGCGGGRKPAVPGEGE